MELFKYIEMFYNRPDDTVPWYLSPAEYEQRYRRDNEPLDRRPSVSGSRAPPSMGQSLRRQMGDTGTRWPVQ
jgi:hypothetical protein